MMKTIDASYQVGLSPYVVTLHEEPGDKFTLMFECWAENAEHACEQAEDAYPGCELICATLQENDHETN